MPSSDIRLRFPSENAWPAGGMVTARMSERNYNVQRFTGYPTSRVRSGQWNRGVLYRANTPAFRPALPPMMYDPTDATTWKSPRR